MAWLIVWPAERNTNKKPQLPALRTSPVLLHWKETLVLEVRAYVVVADRGRGYAAAPLAVLA